MYGTHNSSGSSVNRVMKGTVNLSAALHQIDIRDHTASDSAIDEPEVGTINTSSPNLGKGVSMKVMKQDYADGEAKEKVQLPRTFLTAKHEEECAFFGPYMGLRRSREPHYPDPRNHI